MSDTPYLDALSCTCDNAERWIASRMLSDADEAALARTRDLLALLRGVTRNDVAFLRFMAEKWRAADVEGGPEEIAWATSLAARLAALLPPAP